MILKGNAAALLLWLLLTAIMVLMTGWMHFLGNREPSQQDAQQITRTLQYQTRQLQDLLHWVAALPSVTLRDTVTPVDLRLIVDRADVRLFHLTPEWETERPALLGHLVNYLNQPRAMTYGVMYWRDKVLLVAVHEDRDETRLAGLFLDEWLARLVEDTGLRAKLISNDNIAQLRAEGHALVSLPAMHGQPVYIDAVPVLLSEAIPFRWWVVIPVSVLLSALLVWFFYYRPVWRRVFALQKQVRDIMQSSSFRDRVQVNGRDEIGGLATLFNSLLSSLEYSYNLMAKTNLVSTELLAKMDPTTTVLVDQPEDENNLKQTLDMASRLSEALDRNAIELYLQPVFDRDRVTIAGYEALSRWMDSELGMVLPPEYLAVAEKAGLVEPLTRLTLHQTLDLLRRLAGDRPTVFVSLNLSAAQFFDPTLMQSLLECDAAERALFRHLEVEVKESALTRDFDQASVLITQLRELGIGVCIDDYGLSRYSLMYLQKLPVTSIKLARVFSERISREPREVAFIEGVSRFAGGLGVRVIVKNIENDQQLLSLRADLPVQYQGLALGGLVPAEMV
jgi:EAL domain-containing protein (putative c-di-GMP-specific phosphodiesterase class I)